MLFRLSEKIADALRYFGPYRSVLRIGTDSVWTALTIHQCSEVDCTGTALDDGFVSYYFEIGEIFNLEEEVAPAGKHANDVSAA